jgi:uncharacterized protein YndB with AHSA1/START domain
MEERSVIHSTFVIERSYAVSPERVFAAFADPAKKRRWFVEGEGHDVEHFEMDFQVGGKELARFRFTKDSPVKNFTCTSDAIFQDIVPNRRVVLTSTMTIAGKRISAALATVELIPSDKGTDLILTHQAAFFEGADGPAMREEGWRKLLDRLPGEISQS